VEKDGGDPRLTDDATDLVIQSGESIEIAGERTYSRSVQINGTLIVKPYDGSDATTGTLTLRAPWIIVGPGGKIVADGRGFGGGGAGTSWSSTGKPGGSGGVGGKGGAGAVSVSGYTATGGGGGSYGGAGGTSSYAAGGTGTDTKGGDGGTYSSYKGGVGGSGFGGGGGSGGSNAAERLGGNGAGTAGGVGGQSYSSYYNAILNAKDGGYKIAEGNGDTSTDSTVVKGGGGGGGGASCQYTGGGGGGGAGGGAVMLFSSGNIAVEGSITATGGGGGAGGYYSTSTSYPGGKGGGGAGGGILLSGLKVTVSGSMDARGRTGNTLSAANGGTVKIFYETDQSGAAAVQAGSVYKNGRPKMAGLVSPDDDGAGLIRTEFTWNPAKDPEGDRVTYQLQVSMSSGFNQLEQNMEGIEGISYTSTKDLVGAAFYWRVRAADSGGYGSWSQTWKFSTDITPPLSRVSELPTYTKSTDFSVSWSGTDDSSGVASYDIFVSDNSGPFTPWLNGTSGASTIFNGKDGHRYSFFSAAWDNALNREQVRNMGDTCTTVDVTPPTSSFVSLLSCQSSTEFTITWTGKDATSGIRFYNVYVAEGESPFELWQKEVTRSSARFEGVEGQQYSFYTIACDNAGNYEAEPGPEKIAVVKIDMQAPATQVRSEPPGYGQDPVFISAATNVYLDGSDEFTGVDATFYRIDDRESVRYKSNAKESAPGHHNMTFWSVDRAGNREAYGSFWFFVDGEAPVTYMTFVGPGFPGASKTYVSGQTSIVLEASDSGSGVGRIEYNLDGRGYTTFDRSITAGSSGTHTLAFRSVDRVGNLEEERKMQIVVDSLPPATRTVSSATSSSENIELVFSASDTESGVGGTFFRIVRERETPGDFQPGTETVVEANADHSLDGNYTVQYYSIDNVNNAERIREYKVRIDTSVSLKLENPLMTSVGGKRYVVEGRTEPGSKVMVNNRVVAVSSDGSFLEEVELQPGRNEVVISITDTAGNTITRKMTVTYNEPLTTTSWFLPLAVAVMACAAVAVILIHKRRKRRAAYAEGPPET
jgi:hypothetical protein